MNITTIDENNNEYPFLYYTYDWNADNNWTRWLLFWRINDKLYIYSTYETVRIYWQWNVIKVCKSDTTEYETFCENTSNYTTDIQELYNSNNKYKWITLAIQQGSAYLCFIQDNNTVYCAYNNASYWFPTNLTQSQNLITNNSYIPSQITNTSMFWNSPLIWTTNNNNKPACTNIQTQIMLYWYKYNTWLCYSNDKEWTWSLYTWERVTVTPKSIFEIFTWYNEYKTRRSIYENSCHAPYTQEYCLSRMQGNIYASEIFTKIDNAWLQADKIYQYCYLQLNFTEEEKRSTTNCEALDEWTYYAPWIEKGDWTPNPIEWLTDLIKDSAWYLPLPENWSVFDEILPEWILSREDVALDLNFMKNMVNGARKFMILFTFRKDQPWIIPPYITSLILLFIFYKMLKK